MLFLHSITIHDNLIKMKLKVNQLFPTFWQLVLLRSTWYIPLLSFLHGFNKIDRDSHYFKEWTYLQRIYVFFFLLTCYFKPCLLIITWAPSVILGLFATSFPLMQFYIDSSRGELLSLVLESCISCVLVNELLFEGLTILQLQVSLHDNWSITEE